MLVTLNVGKKIPFTNLILTDKREHKFIKIIFLYAFSNLFNTQNLMKNLFIAPISSCMF